jgi:hypothetical protein
VAAIRKDETDDEAQRERFIKAGPNPSKFRAEKLTQRNSAAAS